MLQIADETFKPFLTPYPLRGDATKRLTCSKHVAGIKKSHLMCDIFVPFSNKCGINMFCKSSHSVFPSSLTGAQPLGKQG